MSEHLGQKSGNHLRANQPTCFYNIHELFYVCPILRRVNILSFHTIYLPLQWPLIEWYVVFVLMAFSQFQNMVRVNYLGFLALISPLPFCHRVALGILNRQSLPPPLVYRNLGIVPKIETPRAKTQEFYIFISLTL
jgi:hypothetical protein